MTSASFDPAHGPVVTADISVARTMVVPGIGEGLGKIEIAQACDLGCERFRVE